jgi:hypothetical protein
MLCPPITTILEQAEYKQQKAATTISLIQALHQKPRIQSWQLQDGTGMWNASNQSVMVSHQNKVSCIHDTSKTNSVFITFNFDNSAILPSRFGNKKISRTSWYCPIWKLPLLLKTCEDNRRNGRLVGERIQICHINTLYKQLNEQLRGVKAIMSFSVKYNGKNPKVAVTGQNRCHYAISMLAW